jgi:hypothetical protein
MFAKLFARKPAQADAVALAVAAHQARPAEYRVWRMGITGAGVHLGDAWTLEGALEFATTLKAQYPYVGAIAPVWVSHINDDMTHTIKHV